MFLANKTEILQQNDKTIKTYNLVQERTCKWTLKNISQLSREIPMITPTFCLEPDGEWHVEVKINYSSTSIFFYLCRHAEEPNIKVEYSLTASCLNGDEICKRISIIDFTKTVKSHDLFPNINVIRFDVILITVKLKIISPEVTVVLETAPPEELKRQTLNTLTEDYKNLYISSKHADAILSVGKQETLSVHKAILSARSAVFEKMFEHEGTLEQQNSIVDIDDISMSTLKELVAFLYCGELVDYDFETAMQVYYAADKYAVLELRQHCGHRVVSGLTRLSAGRALTLAEQHDDQTLRERVCDFILHHYHQDKRNK